MSTGPLSTFWPYGMIFFTFLCSVTIGVLLVVGNIFLYRYITLCRNNLAYIYSSKNYLIIGLLVNLLLVANWVAMILFGMWPNETIAEVAHYVWNGEIELFDRVYIGFTSWGGADTRKLAIVIESLVMMLAVAQLNPFCAFEINRCLKNNSMSDRTKEIHKKMLILLTIQ
ncbi:hypothetical protein OSTOST_20708, partial [Ostertagia ostertagi]